MIGRPLLVATSALASLGDAMFGYSQGIIAANQVQPSFIKRMFGQDVTMEQIQTSSTGVNPFIVGALFQHCTVGMYLRAVDYSYHCGLPQYHCSFLRLGLRICL